MLKVEQINISKCRGGPTRQKILSQPPPCSSGRAIRYRDTGSEYKGPFVNRSMTIVPAAAAPPTPVHAMQALSNKSVPTNWSWHDKGGNKIEVGSRNQAACGCCWAMGFVSALGDRYAIKYNIAAPYPSAMTLISCGGPKVGSKTECTDPPGQPCPTLANQQCTCGGSTYAAGLWLESGGFVHLEECWPFSTVTSPPLGPNNRNIAPECPDFGTDCCADCCGNPASKPKLTVKDGSTKFVVIHNDYVADPEATIHAIKLEIMGNGPVPTSFWEPPDFQEWWSQNAGTKNIYIPKIAPSPPNNGHTVVLTGWGEKDGVKYWEIRNTWGKPSYSRFAMSTSTPKEFWTSIDVPEYKEGSWWGGVVSMLPGPLPDYSWGKGKGGTPVGSGWLDDSPVGSGWLGGNKKVNWKLIVPILVILLVVILIVIIL